MLERCLDLMNTGGKVAYPNGVEPEPRQRKGIRVVAYDGIAGRNEWAARVERGHVLGRIVLRTREEG